ncbi:hypothetical protein [Marinobacter xestospongiae]|uniref:hypothetical protein n=1 Tax=Marinobacter xestospongiae TaxID=994319 RepID=UPI002005BEAF|nr:hypothetical protein [Marinobacter xestospongiae]MCK7569093.1 hypothetical protein [Marinobacter xestospongiae]
MNSSDDTKYIHYNYAIGILIAVIIALTALAYFDVPELVDKFTFALTLSSLLLAILAIFYSIISSKKQDEQQIKITETNSRINEASSAIKSASDRISTFVSIEAPNHFNSLNKEIEKVNTTLSSEKYTDVKEESSEDSVEEFESDETKTFFDLCRNEPFIVMASFYLLATAYNSNRPIKPYVPEAVGLRSIDYLLGFSHAAAALDFLEYMLLDNMSLIVMRFDEKIFKNHQEDMERLVNVGVEIGEESKVQILKNFKEKIDKFANGDLEEEDDYD